MIPELSRLSEASACLWFCCFKCPTYSPSTGADTQRSIDCLIRGVFGWYHVIMNTKPRRLSAGINTVNARRLCNECTQGIDCFTASTFGGWACAGEYECKIFIASGTTIKCMETTCNNDWQTYNRNRTKSTELDTGHAHKRLEIDPW